MVPQSICVVENKQMNIKISVSTVW